MGNNGSDHHQWVRVALQKYEVRLLRYARRIIGDPERARDIVQETFLKLCRHSPEELNGRLAQWLYTVCRNQALDVKRKESRMTIVADQRVVPPDSPQSGSAHHVELQDETERVLSEVERLSENQQECLRLKFQEGLTYREIAAVTGLSVSNVGFTIHAALKVLRLRLRECDPA